MKQMVFGGDGSEGKPGQGYKGKPSQSRRPDMGEFSAQRPRELFPASDDEASKDDGPASETEGLNSHDESKKHADEDDDLAQGQFAMPESKELPATPACSRTQQQLVPASAKTDASGSPASASDIIDAKAIIAQMTDDLVGCLPANLKPQLLCKQLHLQCHVLSCL